MSFYNSLCPLLSRCWEWKARKGGSLSCPSLKETSKFLLNFNCQLPIRSYWEQKNIKLLKLLICLVQRCGYLSSCWERATWLTLWCKIMLWFWNESKVSVCWTILLWQSQYLYGSCSVSTGKLISFRAKALKMLSVSK